MQVRVRVEMPTLTETMRGRVSEVMPRALNALSSMARDRLVSRAQKQLKGTQLREYIKGLTQPDSVEVNDSTAVVRLVGDFATSIEQGGSAFSIKAAMLKKAPKKDKDGDPYVDVPLRHGTEEDASNLQGLPKGIGSSMQSAVKSAQSALRATGMKERDVKLSRTRIAFRGAPETRTKTMHPGELKLTTTHKSGIYDDMLRVPKQYKKAIQATYMTIRRISLKSAPSSWIHPGSKPINLFDGVADEIQKLAPRVVADMFDAIGGK